MRLDQVELKEFFETYLKMLKIREEELSIELRHGKMTLSVYVTMFDWEEGSILVL